ncbi:MAG TPA: helix-turn-helix transcriptional regulator [Acetobacteraceae bacterium]|nr:helix-turn-helix transcriptional regulator [Acetobacteraceae bacterium]
MNQLAVSMTSIMMPSLCREARTLLDLELSELAFVVGVPVATLAAYEAGEVPLPDSVLTRLRAVFKRGGAVFVSRDGGRGVELQEQAPT